MTVKRAHAKSYEAGEERTQLETGVSSANCGQFVEPGRAP